MKTRIIPILLACILIFIAAGCSSGSFTVLNGTELNTPTSISMTYDKFNGYKATSFSLAEKEKAEVAVEIVSESGKVNLSILDESDKPVYQGQELPTSSFSVTLDKPGKYTIKVTGENHSGSYHISWEKTKNN